MKELEYKNINGLEEVSDITQLDELEATGSKTFTTRMVFDFSRKMTFEGDVVDSLSKPMWKNLLSSSGVTAQAAYRGQAHEAHLLVKDLPIWSDLFPQSTSIAGESIIKQFNKNYSLDISGEKEIPKWDENAIIFLDEPFSIEAYQGGLLPGPIKEFRTGYVEFTFKTDKENQVIALGTTRKTSLNSSGASIVSFAGELGRSWAERTIDSLYGSSVSVIDEDTAMIGNKADNSNTLYIKLKNGKLFLEYSSDFGDNKEEFSILGNKNLADDEWHHVVINFGKPGVKRIGEKKFNEKFIDFWIDGKLDKRVTNKSQRYFPVIEWLMMDALLIDDSPSEQDYGWFITNAKLVGLLNYSGGVIAKTTSDMVNRIFDNATATAFRGSIHHFVAGLNAPLDQDEIQKRHSLYIKSKIMTESLLADAKIIDPVISTNKKKALKLFWNNLAIDKARYGLELDKNISVYSYSLTHMTKNSSSEIFNVDLANNKKISYLEDVKVALTDNVLIFGPGRQLLTNRPEVWNAQLGEQIQVTPNYGIYDAVNTIGTDFSADIKPKFSKYGIENLPFSGIDLQNGDRILLTNQINKKENGIYVYNGLTESLTRDEDSQSPHNVNNAVVRVIDGYYKDTFWSLNENIQSLNDAQNWTRLEYFPNNVEINSQPFFTERWSDDVGNPRFIDVLGDININDFDLIVFMNYPENFSEIEENFSGYMPNEVQNMYDNFINSLKIAVANGANLFVSSPKLAEDLGIVREYSTISQLTGEIDPQAAYINPFEINESSDRFFDVHRNNKYYVDHLVTGLTDAETWIMTDFISYIPEDEYDNNEWHAKYSYRQFGLQEGDEFLIPGLALLPVSEGENLPGFRKNYRGSENIYAVAPNNILAGTAVTKLSNVYCDDGNLCPNPYDDYATTIVVHNGQLLGDYPINGKIFVNCTEDSYTFSREDYNRGIIQNVPSDDPNETVARLGWQYSTRRLARKPQKINIKELTEFGQTVPTNGGGGPIIQSATNSSNGIIRSETDRGNKDYESDLYPSVDEEIYPIQEIPVLSMTWLGLNWLAG